MKYKGYCELCGKKTFVASTMFFGLYCIDCIKTVIDHCKRAIKEIKENK